MKTKFTHLLLLAGALAVLPAQEASPVPKASAAEQAYRDGWWAESGQGDLTGALAKYLAAAIADGPAAVRAKALLQAGAVQQRLGKTESALATFRQLLKDHPAEADLAEQARVHLRELTAVDLSKGYDEWYERRLFSEEVQMEILQTIRQMGDALLAGATAAQDADRNEAQRRARTTRGQILAHGKGAVPALRKVCQSGQESLAEAAAELLFALGQVPPIEALQRLSGWTEEAAHWRLLLGARGQAGSSMSASRSPRETLVLAAIGGVDTLLDAVLKVRVDEEDTGMVRAAAVALMQIDGNCRGRLLAAMGERQVPLTTRRAMQRAVCESEERLDFTADEWLQLGADPLVFELRLKAVQGAAMLLGAADAAVLDTLLDRVAEAPVSPRREFLQQLSSGLRRNGSPLLVPWTEQRLMRFLQLECRSSDDEASYLLSMLRGDAALRTMLARSIFVDPVAMHRTVHPPTDEAQPERTLAELLQWIDVDDRQVELLSGRWNADLREVLAGAWPQWNGEQRSAAIALLAQCAQAAGDSIAWRRFFGEVRGSASTEAQLAIDAMLQSLGQ